MPKTQGRARPKSPAKTNAAPRAKTQPKAKPKPKKRTPAPGSARVVKRAAPAAKPVARTARSLPVLNQPKAPIPCLDCGLCCSYIAVEIDGPSTLHAATNILWYLYHQNACVYVEDDEWILQIEARCQHYQDDHKCAIYATRPQICREYDETSCEVNADEIGTVLYTTGEYLDYLARHHKRMHTLIRKSYMPPAHTLQGQSIGKKRVGPFRPRYEGLRNRRVASPA